MEPVGRSLLLQEQGVETVSILEESPYAKKQSGSLSIREGIIR